MDSIENTGGDEWLSSRIAEQSALAAPEPQPEGEGEGESWWGPAIGTGLGVGIGLLTGGIVPMAALGFAGGMGWLDFLGRPARTLIHTQDPAKAWDAIWDDKKSSTVDDVLKMTGWEPQDQGEGFDTGDVLDFIARAGAGVATDPLTYILPGSLSKIGAVRKSAGFTTAKAYTSEMAKIEAEARHLGWAKAKTESIKGLAANRIAREHNAKLLGHELSHGMQEGALGSRLDEPFQFTMKKGMMDLTDIPTDRWTEESMDIARAMGVKVEQKGTLLDDQLKNMGLKDTLAQRVAAGEQYTIGIGNPFGSKASIGFNAAPIVNYLSGVNDVLGTAIGATKVGGIIQKQITSAREFIFNPVRRDAFEELRRTAENAPWEKLIPVEKAVRAWHDDVVKQKLTPEEYTAFIGMIGYGGKKGEEALRIYEGARDVLLKGGPERLAKIQGMADEANRLDKQVLAWMQESGVPVKSMNEQLSDTTNAFLSIREKELAEYLQAKAEFDSASRLSDEFTGKIDEAAHGSAAKNLVEIQNYASTEAAIKEIAQANASIAKVRSMFPKSAGWPQSAQGDLLRVLSRDAKRWAAKTGRTEVQYWNEVVPVLAEDRKALEEMLLIEADRRIKNAGAAGPSAGVAEAAPTLPQPVAPATAAPVASELPAIARAETDLTASLRRKIDILSSKGKPSAGTTKLIESLKKQLDELEGAQPKLSGSNFSSGDIRSSLLDETTTLKELGQHQHDAQSFGRLFGVRVEYKVGMREEFKAKGAWYDKSQGTVYVDASLGPAETMNTIGHEILHDVVASVVDKEKVLLGASENVTKGIAASKIKNPRLASNPMLMAEEILADASGRNFTDPEWIAKIIKTSESKEFTVRILESIDAVLEKLKGIFYKTTDKEAKDAIRKQAADLLEARRRGVLKIDKANETGPYQTYFSKPTPKELANIKSADEFLASGPSVGREATGKRGYLNADDLKLAAERGAPEPKLKINSDKIDAAIHDIDVRGGSSAEDLRALEHLSTAKIVLDHLGKGEYAQVEELLRGQLVSKKAIAHIGDALGIRIEGKGVAKKLRDFLEAKTKRRFDTASIVNRESITAADIEQYGSKVDRGVDIDSPAYNTAQVALGKTIDENGKLIEIGVDVEGKLIKEDNLIETGGPDRAVLPVAETNVRATREGITPALYKTSTPEERSLIDAAIRKEGLDPEKMRDWMNMGEIERRELTARGAFGGNEEATAFVRNYDDSIAVMQRMVDDPASPLFERLNTMRDGEMAAIPSSKGMKNKRLEGLLHPKKPQLGGVKQPWMMTFEEWIDELKKTPEGQVAISTERAVKEHRQAIVEAVRAGEVVPSRVLKSYPDVVEFRAPTKIGTRATREDRMGGEIWRNNTRNMGKYAREEVVSAKELLAWRRLQRSALEKTASLVEKKTRIEMLDKTVATLQHTLDNTPEHIHAVMTHEATRGLVGRTDFSKPDGGMTHGALRKIKENGRYLTPADVNDLIKQQGKEGRLFALGGKLPEGDIPLRSLLTCLERKPSQAALEGWATELLPRNSSAEAITKKANELGALPISKRIEAVKGAYAKLFEERPEVAMLTSIETAAKQISNQRFLDGVRNLFARKMKTWKLEGKTLEEATEKNKNLSAQIKDAKDRISRTTGAERRAARRQYKMLKEQKIQLGGRRLSESSPGTRWVAADDLDPSLKGYELKEETYKMVQKQLLQKDSTQMYKDLRSILAPMTSVFKELQLSWAGSIARDVVGNKLLRLQNDGFHMNTVRDSQKLWAVAHSKGDPEILNQIKFSFPDRVTGKVRNMTGKEMWDHAMSNGMMDVDMLSVEVKRGPVTPVRRVMGAALGAAHGAVAGPVGAVAGAGYGLVRGTKDAGRLRGFLQNLDRLEMFHARLSKGDAISEASSRVEAALYNYRNVTPFVDSMRTLGIMPFATWSAKNIPAQIDLFVHHPGQFAALLHAKEAAERGVPGVSDKDLPSYLSKKFNIILGRTDDGKVIFRTLDGVVPMADLPTLPKEGAGAFIAQIMGPLPKAMYQMMTDRDLFDGRKVQEYEGQMTPVVEGTDLPLIPVRQKGYLKAFIGRPLTIVEQQLGWQNETPAGPLRKPRGFFERSALVSALTGIGFQYTDPQQNALNQRRDKKAEINRAIRDAAYYRSKRQFPAAAAAMKRAQQLKSEE